MVNLFCLATRKFDPSKPARIQRFERKEIIVLLIRKPDPGEGDLMARIAGIEKKHAPWHLRWFYTMMRKMFGKDLTPAKMQMRLPGAMWGSIAMEMESQAGNDGYRCATCNW